MMDSSVVTLAVNVDDIIPVFNDINMLKGEKGSLCEEFEMVDQGEIHIFLGMSIKRNHNVRTLSIRQKSTLLVCSINLEWKDVNLCPLH